jgi:hypothetical protein
VSEEAIKILAQVAGSIAGIAFAFLLARWQAARAEEGKIDAVSRRFENTLRQQLRLEVARLALANEAKAQQEHNLLLRQKLEQLTYQAIEFRNALQGSNPYQGKSDTAAPVLFLMQATISLYFPNLTEHMTPLYACHSRYRNRQLDDYTSGTFDVETTIGGITSLTKATDDFIGVLRETLQKMMQGQVATDTRGGV